MTILDATATSTYTITLNSYNWILNVISLWVKGIEVAYSLTSAFLSFVSQHQQDHDSGALLNPEILKIHLPHVPSCIEEYGFLHHLKDALI